jgi:hypothetical protein
MKNIAIIFASMICCACAKQPTPEQLSTVIKTCEANGMEYQFTGYVIKCWVPKE